MTGSVQHNADYVRGEPMVEGVSMWEDKVLHLEGENDQLRVKSQRLANIVRQFIRHYGDDIPPSLLAGADWALEDGGSPDAH